MKLIEAKCYNCGASIQVEEDRKICFCSYCGTRYMVDDGTIHIIDEAKIREVQTKADTKQITLLICAGLFLCVLSMIMVFVALKFL